MAWCFSLNCVSQRRLQTVYFAVVTFWHFLTGAIIGLLYLTGQWLLTGVFLPVHDTNTYGLLAILCLTDFSAVNFHAIAFANDSSAFLAILSYLTVFYGFLIDQICFDAPISHWDIFGALAI